MTKIKTYSRIGFANYKTYPHATVAQSVERILGKDEVRQFKSAQQLQMKNTHRENGGYFLFLELPESRLELPERGRQ